MLLISNELRGCEFGDLSISMNEGQTIFSVECMYGYRISVSQHYLVTKFTLDRQVLLQNMLSDCCARQQILY